MTDAFQVAVSTGTYHLPFDRLISWAGRWAATREGVALTVQHGVSRPLPGAQNHDILAHEDLLRCYTAADVVVLQGGAGGIMDARQLGLVPIVVPRIPDLHEVIDHHQVVFARELEQLGIVHVATTASELDALLDAARAGRLRTREPEPVPTEGADVVAAELGRFPAPRGRAAWLRRIPASVRSGRGLRTPPT